MSDDKPLAERISIWLRERVEEAGAKGLVVGMSGGIDSSVAAALAKKACGDGVLGLIMPCHSNPSSTADAFKVADFLGIRTHVADLTDAYEALISRLPHTGGIELSNVRPRLRMTALYCAAQAAHYLVCGTSNKTETMIGYFTKWGDAACDIQPLAGLYKSQVYRLARDLGIPDEIIEKTPTADLWEGQTDEGEIGMTYAELDAVLHAIESGYTTGCNPDSVQRVRRMMARSEHKRGPIPVFEP